VDFYTNSVCKASVRVKNVKTNPLLSSIPNVIYSKIAVTIARVLLNPDFCCRKNTEMPPSFEEAWDVSWTAGPLS